MEIHYLFVFAYKNLKNADINLSARFLFEMQMPNFDDEDYRLVIKDNPDFIPGFFVYPCVENVTAIIGKNGSGKTTILDYIRTRLPHGNQAMIQNEVFVFSKRENGYERFYLVRPEHFEFDIQNDTQIEFIPLIFDGVFSSAELPYGISNAHYIYYSYLLHFDEAKTPWDGISNISTANLLVEERRKMDDEGANHVRFSEVLHKPDLDFLHRSEVAKAIQFLIGEPDFVLPFERPKELTIEIDYSEVSFFKGKRVIDDQFYKTIGALEGRLERSDDVRRGFLDSFLFALLINHLLDERKYSSSQMYIHPVFKLEDDVTLEEYVLYYFDRMHTVDLYIDGMKVSSPKHETLAALVPSLYSLLREMVDSGLLVIKSPTVAGLQLTENTEKAFRQLMELYILVKGINSFLHFKWRGLSGGEQSFLSFMSRFHHVARHSGQLPSDLVILIDEGDAAYHPEWQRRFFNDSLKYLARLFADKHIQLIFTANTPFLTSDLTKAHVLFIEKQSDFAPSEIQPKLNERDHTFAANIHSLFSNSFYLDGILVGEFAKRKIQEIIDHIKEKRPPSPTHRKLISMIGESILRHKLEAMWKQEYDVDEEIALLELRLRELKSKQPNNEG